MKFNNLNEQKPKNDRFVIVLMSFTFVLGIAFAVSIDFEQLTRFEKVFVVLPAVVITVIGISLYVFFSQQITDIKISGDKIVFVKLNGKKYCADKGTVIVKKNINRYLFILPEGKTLKAYKFMSFDPFIYKKSFDLLVEQLISNGAIKYDSFPKI